MTEIKLVRKGEIYWVELDGRGSITQGKHPCIVLQNNVGNKYSPNVVVAPISSKINKERKTPTHVRINPNNINGLAKDSIILLEEPRPISKSQLQEYSGKVSDFELEIIDEAIKIQFGIRNQSNFDITKAYERAERIYKLENLALKFRNRNDEESYQELLEEIEFSKSELKKYCESNGQRYVYVDRKFFNTNVG